VARADDTFMPVKVEMGVRQGGWWQVNSGLVEGDRVIAQGAALLGSMPHPDGTVTQVLPGQNPASHAHGSGEPHQH
jgi:multidrug efflux pump subunit AcrA (membrane-fusion protein)